MSRAIYALLVGIDQYPSPIPTLQGCVNDIDAIAAYLAGRANKDVTVKPLPLRNGTATRQAVIAGFKKHLGQAGNGDVALFYYSGHGSQEQAPPEFWELEPDHLDETIVCVDSRNPGCWDLADKEIAKLIADVAAQGAHVVVILDCCHSGSGTRDIGTVVRRAPTDLRVRPLSEFLVSVAQARDLGAKPGGGFTASEGRHVLFAACRDDQEAKEYNGDGKHRGAFSFFLGDALKHATGALTYRDLFARASALVGSQVVDQSPQLESTLTDDLDGLFLDGTIQAEPATFTASFQSGQWTINAGAANGIPAAIGEDVARVALFAFDAPAAALNDSKAALATARVATVLPASSQLAVEGATKLDPQQTYKALLISLPTPRLAVVLEGDQAALGLVSVAMHDSLFLRAAAAADTPEFRLSARDGQFIITKPNDARPLVARIDGLDADAARRAVQRLEHMARWTQTARLSNPTSTIQPGDVKLAILVDGKEVTKPEIRLEYGPDKDGKPNPPTFRVSMTNKSDRRLYCALLDLTQRYMVDAGLQHAGCVKLEPGETAFGLDGKAIPAQVPDELWKQGVIEYKDLLKLIVCTDEFDARLLQQPSLDMPKPRTATRDIPRNGSLNRLMQQVQTRELGGADAEAIDDWQTSQVAFTTVRPLATAAVAPGRDTTLTAGVKLAGHPTFQAQARMMTAPVSSRDLGDSFRLPRLLYEDPTVCQPLTVTASRGGAPGLSVLELTQVQHPETVTPDAPLLVTVPVTLAPNEHVLPIAYDGEFFLPLGRVAGRTAAETTIQLDRLPPPVADTRSLGGAIKIFFQKVISKVVGQEFVYPVLAVTDVAADGSATYTPDPVGVRDRVAKAKRILLFVHGIIGDTQSIVPCAQLGKLADGKPLGSLYDLILAFDYENLNTKIEENGRLLKERLAAVGLGPGHGKTFDIAAHSMGGLVSRWFIEREGGNQVVRRLVMLGTPNGGSPWPSVVDFATMGLGLALNNLTAIPWPSSILSYLAGQIESPTVALNEMLATSAVLGQLTTSPDPGIPYVMVAGNTSLIPAATTGGDGSVFRRLLARLTTPQFLHDVANPFFLGAANDVAVSVTSMENLPLDRKPALKANLAACDHMSYFQNPEGLKALAAVLADGA